MKPLDGVDVVSLAVNLPGPLAAARLREFGATVTKVEPPAGDPLAAGAPQWYSKLTSGQRVEPHFFAATLNVFGADETHASMQDAFASKTTAELEAIAAKADIPLTGVR
jgi:crotonobetainyl-CoA:carnitine CoA-transferase CaiB-like acyl-CoA transferase